MKVTNSLKSLKKRDKNCRIVRRKGRVYVINKVNPRFKARRAETPAPPAVGTAPSGAVFCMIGVSSCRRGDDPDAHAAARCRRDRAPRRDRRRSRPHRRAGEGVIVAEDERRAYETDGAHRLSPEFRCVVVLPSTTDEVARGPALLPRQRHIKVVPRGAGTSLSGGALPLGRRHPPRARQVQPHPRDRFRQPLRRGAAGRHQSRHLARGRSMPASITRPIRRARSPARSAATSPRIRAACIASNTASPPTTCWASSWC